jgi:hypothetical protein
MMSDSARGPAGRLLLAPIDPCIPNDRNPLSPAYHVTQCESSLISLTSPGFQPEQITDSVPDDVIQSATSWWRAVLQPRLWDDGGLHGGRAGRVSETLTRRRFAPAREQERASLLDHGRRGTAVVGHHRHRVIVGEIDVELRADAKKPTTVSGDAAPLIDRETVPVVG